MKLKSFLFTCLFLVAHPLEAAIQEVPLQDRKCQVDYTTAVDSQNNHCLRLVSEGKKPSNLDELVIYLHGDYGVGGASYMSAFAAHLAASHRFHISLIRPGYYDDAGNFSTGNSLGVTSTKIAGRLDNYTQENVQIIGKAITNLKNHYQPKRLLLIGHSGGAAIAALLLNEFPHLANGALLINCPCDVKHWRPDWENSLSPIEQVNHIPKDTVIRLLAGAFDGVVMPELSKNYAEQLQRNGHNVKFYLGLDMEHNFSDPKTREMALSMMKRFLAEDSH